MHTMYQYYCGSNITVAVGYHVTFLNANAPSKSVKLQNSAKFDYATISFCIIACK